MIPPGGGQDELSLVVAQNEFEMPNGLCFSPDESLLYINDTPRRVHQRLRRRCRRDDLERPPFAEGIGDGDLEKGGLVDGMKCDERGNIWVTGPDGVWVFSAEGEHLGVVGSPRASATSPGAAPTGTRCSCRRRTSVYTRSRQGRAAPRALHALKEERWPTNH